MEARQILLRFYEAETKYLSPEGGDFAVIAELLHQEVVMHQAPSLPYAGEWKGHDGFRLWMDAFSKAWSALAVENPKLHVSGDTVFSRSTLVATARASGISVSFPMLQEIRIRDGKISEFRPFYWDTATLVPLFESASS